MVILTLLVLAVSVLSTASPTLSKKACMPTPSTFTIGEFTIFTPAAGNTHAPNLFFTFGDENYSTDCTSNITSNPTTPIACANSNIQYEWDGSSNTLTVGESYTSCDSYSTALAVGSIFIALDCIPAEVPFGDGTDCEDPVGELTGEFTEDAWCS